jgi:hypothetical protein
MAPALPPGWTIPPGRAPQGRPGRGPGRLATVAGRAKDTAWPAGLAVAWVVVMLALPWLMTPGTAPGPDGEAMPAVQAYVPSYLPGASAEAGARTRSGGRSPKAPDGAGDGRPSAPDLTGLALAALLPGDTGMATAAAADGSPAGQPAVALVAAVTPRPSHPAGPAPVIQAPDPGTLPPTGPAPAVAVAALIPAPSPTPPPDSATPAPATTTGSAGRPAQPGRSSRHTKRPRRNDPVTTATVPERPSPTTATSTTGGRNGGRARKSGGPRRIVSA